MRTRLWGTVSVLASIAASAGVANAADLGTRAPAYKAPAPIVISDWAGFYIGANGGGGWARSTFNTFPRDNGTGSGGFGGGQVGYNWQFGNVVTGVEGDFDAGSLSYTDVDQFRHKTDELASVRARLGYVLFPNLLAYGTGGGGWAHSRIDHAFAPGDSFSQFGWVAGAGLEYKVWGPLIARGEYLHYGFGAKTLGPTSTFGAPFGDSLRESIDLVRGGLSYKF